MIKPESIDSLQAFYDADAAGYFTHRWDRNIVTRADFAATRDILLETLRPQPEQRLLEIGCGPGSWTGLTSARCVAVTALDLSAEMLAEARRRVTAANVTFVRADFATWEPAADTRFDGAYSVRVFEHLPDKTAALRRLRSLLLPGGRVVIITKTAPSIWNGRVRMMQALRRLMGRPDPGRAGGKIENFWMQRATPWQLAKMLRQSGFVNVGVAPVIFRPPVFRGGESEYPLIGERLAAPLLRWHGRLAVATLRWPAWLRLVATLGSETYVAWGMVPGGGPQ